jgi:hypothetical protein
VLVTFWLARRAARSARYGGPVLSRPPPYIPTPLVVIHILLASTGLAIWCVYLFSDARPLAWLSLAMLLPVWLFGDGMFIRWLGSRRLRRAVRGSHARSGPAESRLPTVVVFAHGLAGTVTMTLVLLATLEFGER